MGSPRVHSPEMEDGEKTSRRISIIEWVTETKGADPGGREIRQGADLDELDGGHGPP